MQSRHLGARKLAWRCVAASVALLLATACQGATQDAVATAGRAVPSVQTSPPASQEAKAGEKPIAPTGTLPVPIPIATPPVAKPAPPPAQEAADSPPMAIIQPKAGAEVERIIAVSGDLAAPLPPDRFVTVVVRPLPDGADQSWWVQENPVVTERHWRAQPVYIGQDLDRGKRYVFRVCAVITERRYERGEQLGRQPEGPSSCTDLVRR